MLKEQLIVRAKTILEQNWKNGFTIPTSRLYPFQWNWDSGFVAMGLIHYDVSKAIQEIQSLFSGQWENGMVPHILFHSEKETTYFPNFDFWQSSVNKGAPDMPKSSGITQPPVMGFVLENLLKVSGMHPDVVDFAKAIYPKVVKYHRYFYEYRDPHKEKLFFMYHPWESGRDNSPLWDESLNRIEIKQGDIPAYQRRDTSIADASERPTQDQYDRYVYLLQLGKKYQYDGPEIAEESPFLIQDSMMNALLIKSNKSLSSVGQMLDLDHGEIDEWIQESEKNYRQKFWSDQLSSFASYDLRSQEQIPMKEVGGLIPLYAGLATENQADQMASYLSDLHQNGYFLCPSFDVHHPRFDSKRYWRGPIWPHMNWMVAHGMVAYGKHELAKVIREDTVHLIENFGFFEYYEAQKDIAESNAHGYGGNHFSWTASTLINILKNN